MRAREYETTVFAPNGKKWFVEKDLFERWNDWYFVKARKTVADGVKETVEVSDGITIFCYRMRVEPKLAKPTCEQLLNLGVHVRKYGFNGWINLVNYTKCDDEGNVWFELNEMGETLFRPCLCEKVIRALRKSWKLC